jgi:hypothetical protein
MIKLLTRLAADFLRFLDMFNDRGSSPPSLAFLAQPEVASITRAALEMRRHEHVSDTRHPRKCGYYTHDYSSAA